MTMTVATPKRKRKATKIDPITLSVVWNKLRSITVEAGERIIHSAQSYVMAEARDLGIVLLDDRMQIITEEAFLPCHCLSAGMATKAITDVTGKLEPGDLALANDAYITKSGHLPDWVIIYPVYYKGEIVFYAHFRGHQMDSGGAISGSYMPGCYDCIAEGINIPPVKIMKRGKINEDTRNVIFANVRTPAGGLADLLLVYGSMQKAEKQICEMIDKYGLETVKACCDEMLLRGEKAIRAQISEIRDGDYYGEMAVDWDGSTPDKPVWIRVKLTVKGDEMIFDLSESDDQVDFVNSPLGNTYAYVYLALLLTMDPTVPHNEGAFRPVKIIAPEGKVVNPTRPATYGACACSSGCEIYAACTEALGKANPERAQGGFATHFSVDYAGRLPIIDPRTGHEIEYFGAPFLEEGGSGAVKGTDGWEGVVGCPLVGTVYRGSVEINELIFPFRWNVAKMAEDTEGPGEFVGSRGLYAERECVEPPGARTILMSGDCNGQFFSPPGVAGAPRATLGELYMVRAGKKKRELFYTMSGGPMYNGDLLITRTGGGGGWGNPLARNVARVRQDVVSGLLSAQRARDVYGVVVDPKSVGDDPEAIAIDRKATRELRRELKAAQREARKPRQRAQAPKRRARAAARAK